MEETNNSTSQTGQGMVLRTEGLVKRYGKRTVANGVTINVRQGEIVGLLGPNGAGKTTLFRLIMGLDTPDSGEFEVGETVKVAYVDQQHKDIDPNKSVYQVISGGNDLIRMGGARYQCPCLLVAFQFFRRRSGKALRCTLRR